jgi:tetratricopeptide (TPR) repeat protein
MLNTLDEIEKLKRNCDVFLQVGRFDAAEKALLTAIQDHGLDTYLLNLLGVVYYRQSKFSEALSEFRRAIVADPGNTEASLNLAIALCDLSHYQEAETIFTDLAKQEHSTQNLPQSLILKLGLDHGKLAQHYENLGLFGLATEEYQKALKWVPSHTGLRLKLIRLLIKTAKREEAFTEATLLKTLSPENSLNYVFLGILYLQAGHKLDALKQWNRAVELDPSNNIVKTFFNIGHHLAKDAATPSS